MTLACKYCNLDNYHNSGALSKKYYGFDKNIEIQDGCYNEFGMAYNADTKSYLIYSFSEDDAIIDINFCPFCGEKLNSEDEKRSDDVG